MPRQTRTKKVSSAQVRSYAGKAQEYADAAASEIEAGRFIAATSLAVHAGINASDAVCGARLGERAAADSHDQVLALLKTAGRDGIAVEKELRRLLPLKTKAEYEPDEVAAGVATRAVERARKCVVIAQRVAAATSGLSTAPPRPPIGHTPRRAP